MSTAVTVPATPQTVKWGYLDASLPPIATVASGTEIIVETVSGSHPHIPTDPIFEILPEHLPILIRSSTAPGRIC